MNLIHMQKFNTEIILKGNMFYGKNAFKWKIAKFLWYSFAISYTGTPLGWSVCL